MSAETTLITDITGSCFSEEDRRRKRCSVGLEQLLERIETKGIRNGGTASHGFLGIQAGTAGI